MARMRQFRRRFLHFLPNINRRRQFRDHLLNAIGLARTYEPALMITRPDWRITNLLQFVAQAEAQRSGSLRFLQIGAFDGVMHDDMQKVIETCNVRGILVEPQSIPFARLKQRYEGDSRLTLINGAIDRTSGSRTMYTTPSGDSLVASLVRDHVRRHGVRNKDIVEYQVDCFSIADVMEQVGFNTIDILQIDAEGYDYEIIKSIDFEHISPSILRFEYTQISKDDAAACLRLLAGHNYRFIVERGDVIAVHQSPAVQSQTPSRLAA